MTNIVIPHGRAGHPIRATVSEMGPLLLGGGRR
ncbi:MAG TPA: helicase HerA-like domain-containing protein [Acidiferrobacterales bacterium]|jgi:hypothetical protein